ncbi:MAG: LAGLIDADG family homing endonuclease [Candidatus Hadarchaeota archaeon]
MSGLIDSDGYANRKGIRVSMKNPKFLMEIHRVSEKFFIPTRLWKGYQVWPRVSEIWYLSVPSIFRYANHLSRKVNRIYGSEDYM